MMPVLIVSVPRRWVGPMLRAGVGPSLSAGMRCLECGASWGRGVAFGVGCGRPAAGGGHTDMNSINCHLSISLDGFVAGRNQSLENPIGEGGMRLHQWAFKKLRGPG